jgi:hypothetical protein
MQSDADKLQSLLSMLAERGKLRPYNFPVVQLAMGNTMGAEPCRAASFSGVPTEADEVGHCENQEAPTQLQREAEDMDFEFHWTNP